MFRKVAALAALALIPALTGCGNSTSSQPAKTVTVAASKAAASTSASKATPSSPSTGASSAPYDASSAAADDPDGLSLHILKFGDSFAVPSTKVIYTVGQPRQVKDDNGVSYYGDHVATVVQIDMKIVNGSKTDYDIALFPMGLVGDYNSDCNTDFPEAGSSTGMHENPVRVRVGSTVTYSIRCGADKSGQLTMQVAPDGMSDPWAVYSNEPGYVHTPGQEP